MSITRWTWLKQTVAAGGALLLPNVTGVLATRSAGCSHEDRAALRTQTSTIARGRASICRTIEPVQAPRVPDDIRVEATSPGLGSGAVIIRGDAAAPRPSLG